MAINMASVQVDYIYSLPTELWLEIIPHVLELVGMREAVRLRLVNSES